MEGPDQILGIGDRGADFADHHAGGDIGEAGGVEQPKAGAHTRGQRRHHRIAGARHIVHLARGSRQVMRLALAGDQAHAFRPSRAQDGVGVA